MGAFEYRQAEEIRDAFARHGVLYLFLGKSGAILLGFPDTTQDADLFVEKSSDALGFILQASPWRRIFRLRPLREILRRRLASLMLPPVSWSAASMSWRS
jgi:hypothetical protein